MIRAHFCRAIHNETWRAALQSCLCYLPFLPCTRSKIPQISSFARESNMKDIILSDGTCLILHADKRL